MIPPEYSFGKAKHLFWSASEDGIKLFDTMKFLVDRGFLEQRDPHGEYGEYRWRRDPNFCS
jgi:hypothetical protein